MGKVGAKPLINGKVGAKPLINGQGWCEALDVCVGQPVFAIVPS